MNEFVRDTNDFVICYAGSGVVCKELTVRGAHPLVLIAAATWLCIADRTNTRTAVLPFRQVGSSKYASYKLLVTSMVSIMPTSLLHSHTLKTIPWNSRIGEFLRMRLCLKARKHPWSCPPILWFQGIVFIVQPAALWALWLGIDARTWTKKKY